MYRIRRFGVMKTATVVAIMYMVVVAVFAVPFVMIALVAGSSEGSAGMGGAGGVLILGLVAIFGYGLLGWVFTAIAAAVYNLAAGWVGGIEVQVENVAPPPPLPAWGTTTDTPPPAAPASTTPRSNPPPAVPPAD